MPGRDTHWLWARWWMVDCVDARGMVYVDVLLFFLAAVGLVKLEDMM